MFLIVQPLNAIIARHCFASFVKVSIMSFGQTVSQLSIRNVEALRANTEFDVSRTDRNNNDKACGHSMRVNSPVLASPTLTDDPQALLSRGPEYLRSLIFKRQSGMC